MEKKKIYTTTYFHLIVCGALLVISAFIFLPFRVAKIQSGHDLKYHFGMIRALSVAWDKGSFFSKLTELIGGDYGYGTGLFYSTLPAGICVTMMKMLRLSLIGSIYLEIVLLFTLSGMLVYCFLRRLFRDNRIAAIGSVAYLLFPYFLWDVYVRFAFSEIFLMATLPMIAWGVYELLYRNNPAAFLVLFTVGYTLSILFHFTMTVYVTLFLVVWLAFHIKKVCTKKNILFFIAATCIVVLLAAAYLVPMLSNYAVTETENMGRNAKTLFKNSLGGFGNFYLLTLFLYTLLVGVLYMVGYARQPKNKRTVGRLALIVLSGLLIVMYSPIFPWGILPQIMGMIQYPFRLMLIGGILSSVQIATLVQEKFFAEGEAEAFAQTQSKNVSSQSQSIVEGSRREQRKKWEKVVLCLCCALCAANVIGMPFSLCRRVLSTTRSDVPMAQVSGYAEFDGLGVRKNGDYFPKGCTYEYVSTRMNAQAVAETDVRIFELSDYSGLSQMSFLVDRSGYAVLDIPYILMAEVALHRFETAYTNRSLPITAESYDGGEKTKITFPDYAQSSKIILSYKNAPDFKAYLQEKAFGVLTLEGDVTASNLYKDYVGKYSLDVIAGQNGGVLELPSYYYKGYSLTLQRTDGTYVNLTPVHGKNGFVEVEINENGRLYVEFTQAGFDFVYTLTVVGGIGAVGLFAATWIFQKKKQTKKE